MFSAYIPRPFNQEFIDNTVKEQYRAALGREADPSGLRYYTSMIQRHGWTPQMVGDNMRSSNEGQARLKIQQAPPPAPAPPPLPQPQAPTPLVNADQRMQQSPYEQEILNLLRGLQISQQQPQSITIQQPNTFQDGFRAAQNIKLTENTQGFKQRKSTARKAGNTTKGTSQFRIKKSEGSNSAASGLNIGY